MKLEYEQDHEPGPATHEARDLPFLAVAFAVLVILLGLAASILSMFGLYRVLGGIIPGEPPYQPIAVEQPIPPSPRLIVEPGAERAALQAQAAERLGSYGWVDAEAGIAHIPVERAMELMLERGPTTATVPATGGASP